MSNLFIEGLAFLITLLVTELLSNILLEQSSNGRFKFKLSGKKFNPFIKNEKALLIWVLQIVISGLASIPLGRYFESFVTINAFYYVPLACLSVISLIILGVQSLNIKMNRNIWTAVIVSIIGFILSLGILINWDISNLKPLHFLNQS